MSFKFTLDNSAMAKLEQHFKNVTEHASTAAALELDENTSAGARTGRKWYGLPRRSSSEDEFSQEQGARNGIPHESMNESIDVRNVNRASFTATSGIGFYDQDMKKLMTQEFGSGRTAGRKNLTRTMESSETHIAMLQAAQELRRMLQ